VAAYIGSVLVDVYVALFVSRQSLVHSLVNNKL
jgi:hypothetical protein